jgi:tetratricopeptide (TPR) repeat protein
MGSLKILNKFSYLSLTLLLVFPGSPAMANEMASRVQEIERLVKDNNLQQALSSVETLLKTYPGNPTLLFVQATILEKTGNIGKAKTIYEGLTSGNGGQPEAFNNLAIMYARSGDFESAINTLENAFETHPGFATVYANLKAIYDKLASDAYKIALDLDSPAVELKLTSLDQITDIESSSGQIQVVVTEEQSAAVEEEFEPIANDDSPQQPEFQVDPDALEIDRVKKRVENWADAWASQNLEKYLSHYAGQFNPSGDISLKEWKNQRKDMIVNLDFIIVDLNNLKIDIHGESASASFIQYYKSNLYEGTGNKTLKLRLDHGIWFITREII